MYSKVILIGRLVRDPEMRSTPNGKAVANFTPKPKFGKGSSTGGEPTPPPSGKSWLDAYRDNPNYNPTGYK